MGQKTNPNIFQINKTNEWNSKYIEKKTKDFYLHTINDLEVKKFIYRFFKNYNLSIHNCKINYLNNNLNIFISYQQDYNSVIEITDINKTQKIKFISNSNKIISNKQNKNISILTSIRNYYNYKNLIFKKYVLKNNKNIKISAIKRLKLLKHFKKYLNLKRSRQIKNVLLNNFLIKFFKSLSLFFKNKLISINLIVQPLNNKLLNILNKKKHYIIKKKLIKLKKYQKNNFFKEGINIIFSLINKNHSAFLLSKFISNVLKKLKYHNFFFKFIKSALTVFISDKYLSSKIKGVKIKIKGRLNKAPRAKSKTITIGNLPIFTIDSNINYAETTAFNANGTLGVKVWICYN
jgi:ribosomal protein S3